MESIATGSVSLIKKLSKPSPFFEIKRNLRGHLSMADAREIIETSPPLLQLNFLAPQNPPFVKEKCNIYASAVTLPCTLSKRGEGRFLAEISITRTPLGAFVLVVIATGKGKESAYATKPRVLN
ncbi:hypothetical protein CEXT_112071 [Caerostris extrusa]|uniref:Uncharacterized protein n=1 Tax=Caerostris extrusa TaxID=172846 RepID=A0AAV4M5R9_CAEEX|nr:hypothetical protein CEXT_112071 [Caerostris extrusa]